MSNFSAEIRAKLNTKDITDKLNNSKFYLKNISFDKSKLISDIQSALSSSKFNINIDKVNTSSIASQMQKSGTTAGKDFATSFNKNFASINTTTNNAANTIRDMQQTLAKAKFDRSSIDLVTKDLQTMSLAISNVTTKINGKNLNLSIKGIDELGRVVTIVKQFDYESGSISTVGKTISQSFDIGASAAKQFEKSVTKATNAIKNNSIEKSISKVNSQYNKLKNLDVSVTDEDLTQKLSEIEKDLGTLNSLQQKFSNSSELSTEELVSSYEKYSRTLTKVKNNLDIVNSSVKQFASQSEISKLRNEMNNWLEKNPQAVKKYGDEIKKYIAQLDISYEQGNMDSNDFDNIKRQYKEIDRLADNAGLKGKSLWGQLRGAYESIARYVSVSTVIYSSINAIKQMYQNVYDIDTQMTELKKVTDETAASYSKFLKDSSESAKELGTTISGLVSSTADFARLGYSFSDSQELAKVANIYAVVGDEIDSVETATQSIVSTMAAFDIDADDALSIVDKFNEVGNNYSISSGGIGEALQRSASSMAAANNTLDETIALITAANTVVNIVPRNHSNMVA